MTAPDRLANARQDIQSIDAQIVSLLEDRLNAAERAREAKERMNKSLKDTGREKRHRAYLHFIAELPYEMLEDVYDQIMNHTLLHQKTE